MFFLCGRAKIRIAGQCYRDAHKWRAVELNYTNSGNDFMFYPAYVIAISAVKLTRQLTR